VEADRRLPEIARICISENSLFDEQTLVGVTRSV
jgi:hypothetical protein